METEWDALTLDVLDKAVGIVEDIVRETPETSLRDGFESFAEKTGRDPDYTANVLQLVHENAPKYAARGGR